MINTELPNFKYNGARSLVLLHEKHLRSFVITWKDAKKLNVALPQTDDKDYESLETLLFHVFRAARGYITWICEKLNIPDPEIDNPPELKSIEIEANNYLDHILEKWKLPLIDIIEEKFHNPTFKSNWGVDYCIDAMLEHAVMHPIRHEFQLKQIISKRS